MSWCLDRQHFLSRLCRFGPTTFSYSEFCVALHFVRHTELFEQRVPLLACGGAASRISEGGYKMNSEQEIVIVVLAIRPPIANSHLHKQTGLFELTNWAGVNSPRTSLCAFDPWVQKFPQTVNANTSWCMCRQMRVCHCMCLCVCARGCSWQNNKRMWAREFTERTESSSITIHLHIKRLLFFLFLYCFQFFFFFHFILPLSNTSSSAADISE